MNKNKTKERGVMVKQDKYKLNKLKAEIRQMVTQKDFGYETINAITEVSLLSLLARAYNLITLAEKSAEYIAIEQNLQNKATFFAVSIIFGNNGKGKGETGTYFNQNRNVVTLNLNRSYNIHLGAYLNTYITHELCHKVQADKSFLSEDYNRYEVDTPKEYQALWASSKNEQQAVKFSHLVGTKLIGVKQELNFKNQPMQRHQIKQFLCDRNFVKDGKALYKQKKYYLKKFERPDYKSEEGLRKELYDFFNNPYNRMLIKDETGKMKEVPLGSIQFILKKAKDKKELIWQLKEMVMFSPVFHSKIENAYDLPLPNNKVFMPIAEFGAALCEYFDSIKDAAYKQEEAVVQSVVRSAYYRVQDQNKQNKILFSEYPSFSSYQEEMEAYKSGKIQTEIILTKQDIADIIKNITTSTIFSDYGLFNTPQSLKEELKKAQQARIKEVERLLNPLQEIQEN